MANATRLPNWLAPWRSPTARRFGAACLTSCSLHLALLLILSLIYHGGRLTGEVVVWVLSTDDEFAAVTEEFTLESPTSSPLEMVEVDDAAAALDAPLEAPEIALPVERKEPVEVAESGSDAAPAEPTPAEAEPAPTGFVARGGITGRRGDAKAQLLEQFGGTRESEDAVEMALVWLAAHQRRDGSWRFAFQDGVCGGRCHDPGTIGSTTGATALALLAFLGAGHEPDSGPYGEVVKNGLYYLRGRMLKTARGADFQEGTMYAQGLSAIALCEAWALTRQEELRQPAQAAIDFIANVQHPGGGWRYYPGQPGDTTVFSWQLMALKSGQLGGLAVPSPTIDRARAYLDSVQSGQGAYYGYAGVGKEPGPTAIGLLCRMYFGWRQDDPRLQEGVAYLARLGPSRNDMYFNYYASQVLRHHGGAEWPRFNERLREHLIASQSRAGHERGSWHFVEKHGTVGGRLYTTAICAMILEVYYRHLPIYGDEAGTGF